jgi:hypothetical protein
MSRTLVETLEATLPPNEYTLSQIEVTTFSFSMEEVFVSEVVTLATMVDSLAATHTGIDERHDHVVPVMSIVTSFTVVISYQRVVLPFVTRTQSSVRLAGLKQPSTVPVESNNAVTIGVATGAGLVVAILAGVGVFLFRSMRKSEDEDSTDFDELAHQPAVSRRNAIKAEVKAPMLPGDEPEPEIEITKRRDLDEIDDDLENLGNATANEIWI